MESDVEGDCFSDSSFSPLFCDSGELFTWEEIEKVSLFSFNPVFLVPN